MAANTNNHVHRILAVLTVGTVRSIVPVISDPRRKVEYVTVQFLREKGRRLQKAMANVW